MAEPKASYSPAYRKRIEARLNGLTIEQARSRGISLAAARGHRRRPGEPAEKAKLDVRRRERGELTERERKFARKQAERLNREVEEVQEDMLYLSPEDRDLLIYAQSRADRLYHRKGGSYRYRWDLDPGQPFPFPHHSPVKTLYYYH